MGAEFKDKERHVIPRWRDVQTTGALGELNSVADAKRTFEGTNESLAEKVSAWQKNPTLGFAADLVGAALTLSKFEEADTAARFILSPKSGASPAIRHVAERILRFPEEEITKKQLDTRNHRTSLAATVKLARLRLRSDPRNAVAWADLSRAYASLGEEEKAKRAMSMGFHLGGESRFILRSASRLKVHIGDFDEAHEILRRAASTKTDPWLLASEIASADLRGKTSKFIHLGKQLIESKNFSPLHTAELATAIASVELKADKTKNARRLFQLALDCPNENSLAQIEWALPKVGGLVIPTTKFAMPFTHEARARYSITAADWTGTVEEAINWLWDEPFSTRPATLGSYTAAEHLEDYPLSQRICEDGLIANPNDATLLNNLAFALANQGQLETAQNTLWKINFSVASASTEVCFHATQGFIHFRTGDVNQGREGYEEAVRLAELHNLPQMAAHATINLAREEIRIDSPVAIVTTGNAVRMSEQIVRDHGFRRVLERLKITLSEQAKPDGKLDSLIAEIEALARPVRPPLAKMSSGK